MSNNPLPYRHIQEQTERQLLNIMVDKLCCISENTTANNEYKIAYYQEISSSTGTITVPTGATILLNQLAGGADALLSTIDTVPTGEFPRDSSGDQVDVSSFDASGNWVLSGTPSAYPVALVYWLKISGADYSNLTIANIIEETQLPVVGDLDVNGDLTVTGGSSGSNVLEWDGSELVLVGGHSFNHDLKITELGVVLPSNSATLSSAFLRAVDGSILSMRNNSNSEHVLIRSYESGGIQGYFTAGNIGIGTTSPSARLHVDNTATTVVAAIIENSNVANTNDLVQFQNSTGTVASITNEGGITASHDVTFTGGSAGSGVMTWDAQGLKISGGDAWFQAGSLILRPSAGLYGGNFADGRFHFKNNSPIIRRNRADANPVLTIKNDNASSTGNYIEFEDNSGNIMAKIENDGSIYTEGGLSVNSTTKGFLPPRMTGAQAEAISSPAEGLMVYSTDNSGVTITSKGWWGYDGSTWVKLN